MQRAISRIIRGTCRKFRENDCPTIATEEVRQKKSNKEEFSPKHSISEALGWTTGLILTYELTHRQRRRRCFENSSPAEDSKNLLYYIQNCPYSIATHVAAQPAIAAFSTVNNVRSPNARRSVPLGPRKSIDTTPFLHEPEKFFPNDVKYSKNDLSDSESEDEGIHFDPTISKFDEVRATNQPQNQQAISLGEKVTSDLLSALGAFKFLSIYKDAIPKSGIPPKELEMSTLEALDILEKGAELGSSRALYNIGVAYERMNEAILSKEYYQRAADLGHPLASYNLAVMTLKEGNHQTGIHLMKYAAENGVQEAELIVQQF